MDNENLKIAIVHEFLGKIGGAEKVLKVFTEMFPEAPIFTFIYDEKKTKGLFKNCQIITSSLQNIPIFNKRPRLLLPKLSKAIEEFDFSEYDIVISNSNSFAHGILTKPRTFHLCNCNSPMRYAWDWYFEYLEENGISNGLKGLYIRSLLHKVRIWDRVTADRVDKWLANSENVKKRIKKYYRKESEVLYPPVDIDSIEVSKEEPDDYYVIVSRLEPYKKIDLAIKAFNDNKKQLIIIGEGSAKKELEKMAGNNIEFLGWQSDKSVYEYLRHSKALIFPGEEDFGITPIEAMACGRPVIAFAKGGVLETIIDNETGIFFNESNSSSLKEAITKFENNNFSPEICREQAEKFDKKIFITKFDQILKESYKKYLNKYNENN